MISFECLFLIFMSFTSTPPINTITYHLCEFTMLLQFCYNKVFYVYMTNTITFVLFVIFNFIFFFMKNSIIMRYNLMKKFAYYFLSTYFFFLKKKVFCFFKCIIMSINIKHNYERLLFLLMSKFKFSLLVVHVA